MAWAGWIAVIIGLIVWTWLTARICDGSILRERDTTIADFYAQHWPDD
jgi:hypothetical protein